MYKLRAFFNVAIIHWLLASSISASPSVEGSPSTIEERDTGILRGVNIGGWLILEPWMQPWVFSGVESKAFDQHSFDALPGAAEKLKKHWGEWFTKGDVQELKSVGINA